MVGCVVSRLPHARIVLASLLPLLAWAPVDAGEVQPNRLDFGVVHVGARVQGSVRVFVDAKDARSSKAMVVRPALVRIDSVDQGTQEYGKGNTRGYCDIAVTIDTEKPGELSGSIVMTLNDQRVEIPVSAKIRPRILHQTRVLVADTPFQKYSTSDGSLFDPWRKLVERGGFDVDYLEVRTGNRVFDGVDLAKFDSILLGELGITRLTPADISALRKYAEEGGRVILTANHFFRGTVEKANQVLINYGMEIKDTESGQIGEIEVEPPQITICPLTEGIRTLSFHRPSPAIVLDKDRTMVLVSSPMNANEHFVAIALAGDGQIASMGVSLWWMWVGKADNAILLENMLRKRSREK
jgi:hypothetical protein